MKKKYSILQLCVLLLSLYTFNVNAQALSGVYTIDNTQPTSATNFTSFTAFSNSINASGISGPVTVNVGVTSGPYTEQVQFNAIAGTSATNTITINGNGRTLTFSSSNFSLPHTLNLNGTDYMYFHNLTIEGLGTYAFVVHLWNNADYNQWHGCRMVCPVNGTSSYQMGFSIFGSQTSQYSGGNCGNYNVVSTCTISGGYVNVWLYGNFSTPHQVNNQFINNYFVDFYQYSWYTYAFKNMTIRGNIFERLNRTNLTFTYVLLLQNANSTIVEKNHIRRIFNGQQPNSNTAYLIYGSGSTTSSERVIVRNNAIYDNKTNGSIYALYWFHNYTTFEHNTISVDDVGITGNHTTYGIYHGAQNITVRNNIFSITKNGTGSSTNRFGVYFGSTSYTTGSSYSDNVYNISGSPGNNYVAYYPGIGNQTATPTGFSNWQSAMNSDWTSVLADPMFITVPTNLEPSNPVINNMAAPVGVATDILNNPRSIAMPDPGAYEFFNSPCGGVPNAGSFIVPSVSVCPGSTVNLSLATSQYTNSGFSVQWQQSTLTALGGYQSVPGATLAELTTPPINVTTYYQAVITCTNSMASGTTTPGTIGVAPPTTSTVPYYESFETLGWNRLPNCSWMSSISSILPSSPTYTAANTNFRMPRTGTNFAVFPNSNSAQDYYTNPIYLEPGLTYSATVWYLTQTPATSNWANLSINIGPGQNSTGQQVVASMSPVTGNLYQPLTNTFVVTTAGFYYVNIRATGASGAAPYLSWDDLSIIVPCELNSPNMLVTASTQSICAGQLVHFQASGADSYQWNTGATTGAMSHAPTVDPAIYTVVGTNTLSGCSTSISNTVTVISSPNVVIGTDKDEACDGQPIKLTALGDAVAYMWAHGQSGASTTVTPNGTTTYSVTGANLSGCYKVASITITVNPNPVVNVVPLQNTVCVGDNVSLSATGAATYQWLANGNVTYMGNPITFIAQQSISFLVTGATAKGCTDTDSYILSVEECVGVAENSLQSFRVYPNPAHSSFIVSATAGTKMEISVADVTGRIVHSESAVSATNVSVDHFAAGVYYVTVVSENASETIKLIKQ